MTTAQPLNEAAAATEPPVLSAMGFTAGVDFDLVAAGFLRGTVRRWRAGKAATPARCLRVVKVPTGTVVRGEALTALAKPDASPLPVFEIHPPHLGRLWAPLSWVAVASSGALFAYGLMLAFAAPMSLKAVSLDYTKGLSGAMTKVVRDVRNEDGMIAPKEDDQARAKRFFDRVEELREERGIAR